MKIKASFFLAMLACSSCLASCALGNGAPSEDTAVSESSYDETKSIVSESSYDETKSLNNLEFEVISEDEKTVEVKGYKIYYGDFRDGEEVVIPKTVNGYRVVAIGDGAFTARRSDSGSDSEYSKIKAALRNLKKIIIPSSVTSIGSSAFKGCTSLPSVIIPSSVTSIGGSAFYGCSSLTSVTIPSSVTSIGAATFRECSSLTSISIPSSVASIEGCAFTDWSSLTSISIPEGVTSLGDSAFSSCSSLTSVTIPSSVTSIGSWVFCYSSALTELRFLGTTTQWRAVSKDSAWATLSYLRSVVCSDGTIYL